ncbi:glycoside hydrolase family 17 protein [Stipitochalara longipes BDJ]|nr:glycoside hydrolase family 17 protein [Stipitochalara longipes BDJ]
MKSSTLAVGAVSLLSLVSAQPHRRRHVHEHQNAKKDSNVVVVVDTVYAMAQAPEVVIYVDQDGKPVQTSTAGTLGTPVVYSHGALSTILPTSSSTPPPAPTSTSTTAPTSSSAVAVPASSAPAAAAPAPVLQAVESVAAAVVSAVAPIASSVSSSSEGSGYGVSYSAYKANGDCKSQDDVNKDVAGFGGAYSMVRIYGTACNQVATVLQAAKNHGLKVFAGVSDLSTLNSEIQTIVSAANGDWSSFDTIAIGNELVNSGAESAAAVVAALSTARGLLKTAGYTGHIVTVDTLAATLNYPTLADNSDYAAVNCHPFFDPNTPPSGAGGFIQTQMTNLRAKLANPSQEIVITETGYPYQGDNNGLAVPTLANQALALSSIKSTLSSAVIFLSAYDDPWKTDSAGTLGAERYWGKGGAQAPSG